jgi:N6-L-threonylcarbamoyladenine synthase
LAIAQGFQAAIVDTLLIKCRRALLQTGSRQLVVAGGVAANKALRIALHGLIAELKGRIYFPSLEYCTDNGAMIAYAGCLHFSQGQQDLSLAINVRARWPLMAEQDSR